MIRQSSLRTFFQQQQQQIQKKYFLWGDLWNAKEFLDLYYFNWLLTSSTTQTTITSQSRIITQFTTIYKK